MLVKERSSSFWIFVLLGLLGSIWFFFLTKETAVELGPDGIASIAAADSFLQGKGFLGIPNPYESALMVHHTPFYSILLTLPDLFLHNLVQSVRWLNCILYGLNIGMAGLFAFYLTRSLWPAFLAGLLIAGSPIMLQMHMGTASEVPFISFSFLGFWFLNKFLEDARKIFSLIVASALLAFAYFTRYAAISVIIAGVLGLWLIPRPFFQSKKIFHTILFILISCSLMFLWGLRNKHHAQTHMPWDHVGLRWDMRLPFRELFATLSIWLLPKGVPRFLRWAFLAVMAVGFGMLAKKSAVPRRQPLFHLLALFIVSHVGVYLLFNLGVGYEMIDDRALSAVFFPAAVLFAVVLYTSVNAQKKSVPVLIFAGILLVISGLHVVRGYGGALKAAREGMGFSARKWASSETIAAIKKMPSDALIYTNAGEAIYILTGRANIPLPPKEFYKGPKRFDLGEPFQIQFKKMLERLKKDKGVIVYFEGFEYRTYGFTLEELNAVVPLEVVQSLQDGVILKLKDLEVPA